MDEIATMHGVITETTRVVEHIEPGQLDNPSPCTEWMVRDVLNHITGGAKMFSLCVRDGKIADETLGAIMTGDNLGADYQGAWAGAAADAEAAFAIPGAMERIVTLPFGEMPAGTAVSIAIFDVATHAWDLATATGQSTEFDPEVAASAYGLAQTLLTDDWRATGMFGQPVAVSDDAPIADRLAAFAGRTP